MFTPDASLPIDSSANLMLTQRPRRMRINGAARGLIRENHLRASDFIYPVFITEGANQQQPVSSLPGVKRYSIDRLLAVAENMLSLGVHHMILFPVVDATYKNAAASYALDEDGLIPRAIRYLKAKVPELYIMADVALDPYTSHGQDGIVRNNYVVNDETTHILAQQSLLYAQCGIDMVAPSDMMDGRIRAIRETLEKQHYPNTAIMAYSAKYASHFYGPFRDAVGSTQALSNTAIKMDKQTYQMDSANLQEAIREAQLDIQEGADMIMVKPGLPYLDVIYAIKQATQFPLCAYHVSGEYAMLKLAEQAGLINYEQALLESMMSFKRAGCNAIISYAALEVAALIKNHT